MKPPEAPKNGLNRSGTVPPAVYLCPQVLKNRSDFLKAARARKQPLKSMLVQGRKRPEGEAEGLRVGFTCSKKVGNAVARNRAKRRMREVARLVLPTHGRAGWDYILVGRKDETANLPFDALTQDLIYALRKIHGGQK